MPAVAIQTPSINLEGVLSQGAVIKDRTLPLRPS